MKHWNSKNFKEIEINFQSFKKNITVRCGGYWNLDISVSGIDSIWVSGFTKSFEEILDIYKSKNEFFHKSRAYVIYLGIPLLLGLGMLMIIPALIETPMSDLETDVKSQYRHFQHIVLFTYSYNNIFDNDVFSLGVGKVIPVGFSPKLNWKIRSNQKLEKTILGVISAIVLSLLTGGIIIFIQNFSNQ